MICYGRSGVYWNRFTPICKKSLLFLKKKMKTCCSWNAVAVRLCKACALIWLVDLCDVSQTKWKMSVCVTIWRNSRIVDKYWTNCGTWGQTYNLEFLFHRNKYIVLPYYFVLLLINLQFLPCFLKLQKTKSRGREAWLNKRKFETCLDACLSLNISNSFFIHINLKLCFLRFNLQKKKITTKNNYFIPSMF